MEHSNSSASTISLLQQFNLDSSDHIVVPTNAVNGVSLKGVSALVERVLEGDVNITKAKRSFFDDTQGPEHHSTMNVACRPSIDSG